MLQLIEWFYEESQLSENLKIGLSIVIALFLLVPLQIIVKAFKNRFLKHKVDYDIINRKNLPKFIAQAILSIAYITISSIFMYKTNYMLNIGVIITNLMLIDYFYKQVKLFL
jgi:hypothetical protein